MIFPAGLAGRIYRNEGGHLLKTHAHTISITPRETWQEMRHVSTPVAYQPENNPFQTIMVDVTHRCNMACKNCYIPNRDVPDMDVDWLAGILARLPRRARIRLAGAEPTMRADLPDIIRTVRRLGHTPLLLTNGLRISHRKYVRSLKARRVAQHLPVTERRF